MSKIALSGDASGTGTFTIASPNSNSNYTLTLPANSGTVLTSASAIQRSQLPSGSMLQVVQTTLTPGGGVSIASTAGATTVMSLAITPNFSTSKILVAVSSNLEISNATAGSMSWGERLLRTSTQVYDSGEKWFYSGNIQMFEAWATLYLDSPATTSSVTYNFQIVPSANRGDIRYGRNATTIMQLFEIAG